MLNTDVMWALKLKLKFLENKMEDGGGAGGEHGTDGHDTRLARLAVSCDRSISSTVNCRYFG